MADSDVSIGITADTSPLQAALARVEQSVKQSTDRMKATFESVSGAFEKIQGAFLALGAALAGGAAFGEIISQTKEWIESSIKAGIQLGITASEASVYATAIKLVGGSTEDFTDASRGLARQLKTHEEALNQLGVKTRDVNGNLLAGSVVMQNAVDTVNSYREGLDRTLAAQEIFGRRVTDTNAIFRQTKQVTDEARQSNEDLGLTVGSNSVAAFEENRKATAQANLVLLGLAKSIGTALLPILTELAEFFRTIGPAAIGITAGLVDGLAISFWNLVLAAKVVGEVVKAVFDTLRDALEGIFQAIGLAMQRKFTEAGQALKNIGSNVATDWRVAFAHIADDAKATVAKIKALFSDPAIVEPPGGKNYKPPAADAKNDQRLAQFKNELAQMEQAEGDFDGKDLALQMAFWQAKLATTKAGSEADKKLRTEIEKEILSITKKNHDEDVKSTEEYIKQVLAVQEGLLAAKKENLQQQLALGNITNTQELEGEKQLEDQLFAIRDKALQDKLKLATFDLNAQQQIRDQEILLEMQHAAAIQKIVNKEALAQNKVWQSLFSSMESGFQGVISKFLQGTSTMSQFVHQMFTAVGTSIANTLASLAAKNIATLIQQAAVGKTIRAKEIMSDAYAAAAGAYKSVVSIPYVGIFLAPAAAATAFAATAAFSSSAAGGYDIPSGINPVVQTHAREMILPANLADRVRGMTSGGGGNSDDDSGGAPVHVHFPGKQMGNMFLMQQDDLHVAIKTLIRNGKLSA